MSPDTQNATDVALLRAVAAADEAALAELYDRHAGWLLVRLRRRCASADTVDLALQDTFPTLWRNAASYRSQGDGTQAATATRRRPVRQRDNYTPPTQVCR